MPHHLTLLQWNIWYAESPANVLEVIKQIDPDIACLQEVTVNNSKINYIDVAEFLSSKSGLNGHFVEAQYFPSDKGNVSQGNMILSKFPFIKKSHAFVQDKKHSDFDDYSKEGRVLVIGEVSIGNQVLTIATTHLSYTHKFIETKQKLEEENKLLDSISNYDEKFILTGDFNATPESELIKKLEGKLENAGPDFSQNTWTTKPFDYNGFVENELNWRLDYVYTTKDIKVLSAKVVNVPYSDHLPVVLRVAVKY